MPSLARRAVPAKAFLPDTTVIPLRKRVSTGSERRGPVRGVVIRPDLVLKQLAKRF